MRRNKSNIVRKLGLFLLFAPTFMIVAFADYEMGDWVNDWQSIYQLVKSIATPLGALIFAYGGISFLGMNFFSAQSAEKQIEQGKRIMLFAGLGLLALYLLPSVLEVAVNFIAPYAWDPNLVSS